MNAPIWSRPQNPQVGQQQQTNQVEQQKTTQQLRDEIRENVRQQLEAAARATRVQRAGPFQTPRAPTTDGPQTFVTVPPVTWDPGNVVPPQAVTISIAFFLTLAAIIIGLPIARAFARRMDRRGGATQVPPEVATQLTQLSQAVDAIALEVERISEGQRFTTRLLTEQREGASQALPAGTR